jgi:hypothetical protein
MQDTKISSLNKRAYVAASNPAIFQRIEECVLNAKTSLAKRRLVRAAVVLGGCLYL